MLTGTGRTPYTTADLKNLALGSDERRQAYDDLQWAHDDTIAGDHEGSYTNKPDVEEVVEEEKPNLEEAVEGEVVEGEGGDAVMLDEVTVEAAPKGRAKRIADMEQKIIPFFVSSSLYVVATDTESKTASTATPLNFFCSCRGMPNFL